MSSTIIAIPVRLIDAGSNDRRTFDAKALSTLAESLVRDGLAQPITVRPVGRRFEVVCGERRLRAAKLAAWATLPAMVSKLDDLAAASVMLAENTARADLNPVDEARAYARWIGLG